MNIPFSNFAKSYGKLLSSVFYILMIMFFTSCEKTTLNKEEENEDEESVEEENVETWKELPMYVAITHTGNPENFILQLGVEIVGKNIENKNISGLIWDSKTINLHSALFRWDGDVTNSRMILRPNQDISDLIVQTAYAVTTYTEEVMNVKFEFFVNDNLVKTEQISFEGYKGYSGSFRVIAEDYMD